MTDPRPLNLAVVGAGRMGRLHALSCAVTPDVRLCAVVDTVPARAREVAAISNAGARIETYPSVAALLARHRDLDCAVVAVPDAAHEPTALRLLRRGVPCLIEKPMAPEPRGAARLVEAASRHAVMVQVGHTERFNPCVLELLRGHSEPTRRLVARRVVPAEGRRPDVGVVMDLMIHDLDLALMLARGPLCRLDARGWRDSGPHESYVVAHLEFEGGFVADLTASRRPAPPERMLRVTGASTSWHLDLLQRRVATTAEPPDATEPVFRSPSGATDPLVAQLGSFVAAVRNKRRPVVDSATAARAIDLGARVLAALRAASHPPTGLSGSAPSGPDEY